MQICMLDILHNIIIPGRLLAELNSYQNHTNPFDSRDSQWKLFLLQNQMIFYIVSIVNINPVLLVFKIVAILFRDKYFHRFCNISHQYPINSLLRILVNFFVPIKWQLRINDTTVTKKWEFLFLKTILSPINFMHKKIYYDCKLTIIKNDLKI